MLHFSDWMSALRIVGCGVVTSTTSARDLYHALHAYAGSAVFHDVLAPWIDESAVTMRETLQPLAVYGGWRRVEYIWGDLLEQAYALSRVSDLLLLGFQPRLPAEVETPWAHQLHLPDHELRITEDEYVSVFSALGMRRVEVAPFDPFFHEIVAVEQSEDPDTPAEITRELWPCTMLGEMLFNRAGVGVRAGEQHAVAGIADRSALHDVFLRRYRPTSDESWGWGRNSQWKTDFRRDYLTADVYHFNVDARADIDEESEFGDPRLTPSERRDLLRQRCMVRPLAQVTDSIEAWAGCWRLSLPRG
jgi:hypothetical protein